MVIEPPAIHATHLGRIETIGGRVIDFIQPDIDMFDIDDMANGMAMTCRFGGQLPRHYSVAQHSILTMLMAPDRLKLPALLHDAHEGLGLWDCVKPLKIILGDAYKQVEDRFSSLVAVKFHLTPTDLADIKQFDDLAVEIEHQFMRRGDATRWNIEWGKAGMLALSHEERPMVWKQIFLEEFYKLFNK